MRILLIGGTGIISTACTELAIRLGHDVHLLNRGRRDLPAGAKALIADLKDPNSMRAALEGKTWDVVVNFLAFGPEDVAADLARFSGRTAQYVFISSASAYQRPSRHYLVTEGTPLANPFWEYSRQKIAAEEVLMRAHRESGFPCVIVRPSLTYSRFQVTLAVNSWARSYTVVDRMRRGLPVIVPGDGSSLWTITHNTDFAKGLVGLLGNAQTHGHAFHITSDEVMTWDQYYLAVAKAAGVDAPRLVHIASDFLAAASPEMLGTLVGDKATSCVFDNSKIKRFVPGFCCTVPYHQGIAETLAWFDADPARRLIDDEVNANYDRILDVYLKAQSNASACRA
ncbi:SDR family oxidoreductase [Nibricoccus sp. IMCC34717]|uniref:SDR family oxidoreductase n=1 Tax=Nibricoccus sp. IMCC34717 TaxID=3034021 RepID=UPI00384E23D7